MSLLVKDQQSLTIYWTVKKSEFLWCVSCRRQHQLGLAKKARLIDGTFIAPVKSARDLGIYVDFDLLMRTHVQGAVSRCFAVLRQLRQTRRSVPTDTFKTLLASLMTANESRLRQQRAGRSSGLPGPSTAVGAKRGCETDVSFPSIGPHHYSLVCLYALAARAVVSPVQDRSSSSTKSYTDSRRHILVRSTTSQTCSAADFSVLLPPTVWQCLRSSWQRSPTNRAFSVVGPRTCNDLTDDVTSAKSLSIFRQNSPLY